MHTCFFAFLEKGLFLEKRLAKDLAIYKDISVKGTIEEQGEAVRANYSKSADPLVGIESSSVDICLTPSYRSKSRLLYGDIVKKGTQALRSE